MQEIELPDGRVVEFPDGMSHEAMADAIKRNFPEFAQQEPISWADVGKGAVQNFLPSAGRFFGDLAGAVTSPVQTAQALGKTLAGAAQKLAPGDILGTEYKPYAEALGEHYAKRYGDIEGFKRALRDDPVGIAADASAPFTLGSSAVGAGASAMAKVGAAAKAIEAARKISRGLAAAGKYTDPLTPVVSGVKALRIPEHLYSSAVKFPTTMKDRNALIQTGLREGLVPNARGVAKLKNSIESVGSEVDSLVRARTALEESGQAARTINPQEIGLSAWQRADDLYKNTASPSSSLKAAESVIDDFAAHHGTSGNLTTKQAHDIKKATQRTLEEAYGEIRDGASGAAKEANKGIAHGMRQGIEANVPGVIPLNRRLSELLKLRKPFEQAANRIQNTNFFSLPSSVMTAGGISAAGAPALGAGILWNMLTRPAMKARYGIGLQRAGNAFDAARPPVSAYAYPGLVLDRALEKKGMPKLPGLLQLLGAMGK